MATLYECPTSPDIPPQCVGCPRINSRLGLVQELSTAAEESLAKFDELAEANLEGMRYVHDSVSKPADAYGEAVDDIANVMSILSLMPDSAEMTLPTFLSTYRTDENCLGDDAFRMLMDIIKDDEFAKSRLTMPDAIEIALRSFEGVRDHFDDNPLAKTPLAQDVIARHEAAADRLDQTKANITRTTDTAIARHHVAIQEVTGACPNGIIEKTEGLFKKRVVQYCGSSILR